MEYKASNKTIFVTNFATFGNKYAIGMKKCVKKFKKQFL